MAPGKGGNEIRNPEAGRAGRLHNRAAWREDGVGGPGSAPASQPMARPRLEREKEASASCRRRPPARPSRTPARTDGRPNRRARPPRAPPAVPLARGAPNFESPKIRPSQSCLKGAGAFPLTRKKLIHPPCRWPTSGTRALALMTAARSNAPPLPEAAPRRAARRRRRPSASTTSPLSCSRSSSSRCRSARWPASRSRTPTGRRWCSAACGAAARGRSRTPTTVAATTSPAMPVPPSRQ